MAHLYTEGVRALLLLLAASAAWAGPFWVRVADSETGRGVPLVQLSTPRDAIRFWTDSAGVATIDDDTLNGHDVAFTIKSHGYEFDERILGEPAKRLHVEPGGHAELKIRRTNIAERLYRVTGAGIYRDSLLAGLPVPIAHPLLDGGVTGQDTNISVPYQGKLFWCYGDTFGLAAAIFSVSCATSELPGKGGLDPDTGIDLTYFVDDKGFSRAMLPLPRPGLVWIEGLFTVQDDSGRERLVATYTRQPGLAPPTERGIAVFNDAAARFEMLAQLPLRRGHKSSHPFRVTENGASWWYLFPHQRVPDNWKALSDPRSYQSYTPLEPGAKFDGAHPRLEHKPDGSLLWAWKPDTDRIEASEERRLIAQGLMRQEDAMFALRDAATGAETGATPSCVTWNAYRKKWILLAERVGSVYYAEADTPVGPWPRAVKIVSHNDYNFYNVVQHPFFDRDGGRIIYFEGTYTTSFSAAKEQTPRYDYNQILYRLRLDDSRLAPARSAP
ncbi:MAG: hypothetical protein P4L56_01335 [Candidatus Sulfopaludibacter sp.]|nr:hypothetical protein [Candidatus Sulfopaludibacter sp.]